MRYPQAFGRTRFILCYPQYWAWRLSGVAASEVTSLGAQTHLWAPRRDDFSTLSGQQGWRRLFPPRRNAWDTLATLRSDISRHTGSAAATPVLCGLHDSNANYLRYLAAGWDDFSLMSTGTWIINFNRSFDLGGLIAGYDTNTNSDVYGRPVACSRFMGGREYALIAQDVTIPAQAADIERIIRAGVMALPSFSDSGGPFPGTGAQGRVIGPPPGDSAARPTLAVLYSALMAAAALNHIGTENDIIIDGSFAKNVMFCRLLAALFGRRRIWRSSERDGTACGAALLWRLEQRTEPVGLDLQRVEPLTLSGLGNYAARWRELVAADPAARENESRSRKNDD
jgi:sugar (pentulose or hexulose) kinase